MLRAEFIQETHSIVLGYVAWILGVFGAHRFYFGKPVSGIIWFFTLGIIGIGWIIDLFLIPEMAREANSKYLGGRHDYNIAWLLFAFLGVFGAHRFYLGKVGTGVIFLLTGGLLGFGLIYDVLTLNEQIDTLNRDSLSGLN